ncbi:MAG TPA: nuclear transport factor 2 family protein, partial [Candidatus Cybelea sp.]|nr:nuclear transport factor 2 family protein [Candidatus Cybelea sp.]
KHHNAYFPAGFAALQQAMKENDAQFPKKRLVIKNVLGDGKMVAVHSHLTLAPGKTEMVVVHLFRFKGSKIIEMWDCGQEIPSKMPNTDGLF